MTRIKIDQDIHPLSEFRANVAAFVKQLRDTRRPMVLTQRGRGVAVMMDVREFERLQDRLSLLEDIARAEAQIDAGRGISHEAARKQVIDGLTG